MQGQPDAGRRKGAKDMRPRYGILLLSTITLGFVLCPLTVAAAQDTAFVPDYFPTEEESFCKRIYAQPGEAERGILQVVGRTTVPYATQPLEGSLICNFGDGADAPLVVRSDDTAFRILMENDYYTSADCLLSEFPSQSALSLVHDGEILGLGGDFSVEVSKDLSDCRSVDPDERLLFRIQGVTVAGKHYENALIFWGLKDNLPFVSLDFQGWDVEWGLALPDAGDTGGRAVDDFIILGVGESLIAQGDVNDTTGVLDNLAELVAVVCSTGAAWDVFDVPGTTVAIASGINDAGDIVGAYGSPFLPAQAILRRDGVIEPIHPPGSLRSRALGINNVGQIVGDFNDVDGTHGFSLEGGIYTTIDFPGAANTSLFAINDLGQIVGSISSAGETPLHGFLLDGGTFTAIMVPDAIWTEVTGINNLGDAVGRFRDATGLHGFLWSGGAYSVPRALNATRRSSA